MIIEIPGVSDSLSDFQSSTRPRPILYTYDPTLANCD